MSIRVTATGLERIGSPSARSRLRIAAEITGTVLATLDLGGRLTLTPHIVAAAPIGLGTTAENAVTAGTALGWRASPALALTGGYYRAAYGRNVVLSDVITLAGSIAL